jgi:hypothetical protein
LDINTTPIQNKLNFWFGTQEEKFYFERKMLSRQNNSYKYLIPKYPKGIATELPKEIVTELSNDSLCVQPKTPPFL